MKSIFVKMLQDEGKLRDSYTDYWTMVTMWGYATCLLGEIEFQSDNVYIISPDDGNSKAAFSTPAARDRKCKLVWLELEWPKWDKGTLSGNNIPDYFDEQWVCDKYYFQLQQRFNPVQAEKVRYFFLGGHPDFGNPDHGIRRCEWDFAPLSYNYGVRDHKLQILSDRGFTIAPNAWGEEREYILRNSKWGLHLQQFPMPFIAPQRFLLFASHGLPIVSDVCADPSPYLIFQDALIHWDPRESSLMNNVLRREAVEWNFNLVRNRMTFKSQVDIRIEDLLSRKPARVDVLAMSPDDQVMAKMNEERFGMYGSPEVGKL